MEKHEIIIVGAGASGVYLSLLLADYGKDILLLEAKDRILKKLLTTGNGRCNITNETVMDRISDMYTSENDSYTFSPLRTYDLEDTLHYFSSLGLNLTTLDDHKMYPYSLQSSSVVDLLRLSLEEKGVPLKLNEKVTNVRKKGRTFLVTTNISQYECDKLVISSGGMAAPGTGSDGSMYKILCGLGHHVITPMPSLVQMKLSHPALRALSGVKINGSAVLSLNDVILRKEEGELLFTDYGISGPPILQLSRFLHPHLENGKELLLTLDFFPEKSPEEVKEIILNHAALFSYRSAMDVFKSLLPSKLIPVLLRESGLDRPSTVIGEVNPIHLIKLAQLLKEWSFPVTGTQGFNMAQGTYGGVDTREVRHTLESLKVPNLYLTGEVLDVLGACGGFNLQWAWSTAGTVMKALTGQMDGR
ncbi:MAG: NAD(P)/FAD-dependent oxidoreductase [Clostridia bacterium]|nr:NAD(P)/FAD-dependent oxidoreductase [Clostridia bacterium]